MSLAEIDGQLYELERAEALYQARQHLLPFIMYTFPGYQVNWHHVLICNFIMRWVRGEFKNGMIFTPPRMGKSEIVSRRLPAFLHGMFPKDPILAASYNASLASDMTQAVQRIMDSPEYSQVFPNSRIIPPGERKVGQVRTQEEHTLMDIHGRWLSEGYRGQGVDGTFTGRGAPRLLIDDPIKGRADANSIAKRKHLIDWYVNDFSSRGADDNAQTMLVQTRWHVQDLAGNLIEQSALPDAEQWEILELPAIKEVEAGEYDKREIGEALWPVKFSLAHYEAKRASNPEDFESIYQQKPIIAKGGVFKREWTVNRYDTLPDLPRRRWDASCIVGDLRFKDSTTTGDMVVYQAWARTGADIYYLGESRGRWSFFDSVKEFLKIINRFPFIGLKLIENKANGPALESLLKRKIQGIELKEPGGSKAERVHAIAHLWRGGNVWLPTEQADPNIRNVINEWVSFGPGCAFDDRTDTMTMGLRELDMGIAADGILDALTQM